MKVTITKDHFDGSKSQGKETGLDGTNITSLLFLLMEKDVASITITKADILKHIKREVLE